MSIPKSLFQGTKTLSLALVKTGDFIDIFPSVSEGDPSFQPLGINYLNSVTVSLNCCCHTRFKFHTPQGSITLTNPEKLSELSLKVTQSQAVC